MAISGVSPLAGALLSGGLREAAAKPAAAGGSSRFGPAFLFTSSAQDVAQGLYNSLGKLLGTGNTSAAAATAAASSRSQRQRTVTLSIAAASIDAGNTRAGRALAQHLLDKNGDDVTALRLVAHSYLAERDYKQAERHYGRAAALAPDSKILQGELANARVLQESDDQVLAEGRRRIKTLAHRTQGLRLLLHLSKRRPRDADVHLALADGFSAARQPVEVIGALQKALRNADKRQVDEVIIRAERLVEDDPQVGVTRNILGRALKKAGRLNEAITQLEAATDLSPTNFSYRTDLADAYVDRARTKLSAGSITSAETDLRNARSLYPANRGLSEASTRVAAGRAGKYIITGHYNRALGKLATATSKAPDDVQFKKQLAVLYGRVAAHYDGKDDDVLALSAYTKAYELDPSSSVARRNVGRLGHQEGLAALGRLNYDRAIDYLDRAYQTARTNDTYRQDLAKAYDARGEFYMNLEKYDQAVEDFKKGFALDPSNTSLNGNLSSAMISAASA